jgi:hypothetical protein
MPLDRSHASNLELHMIFGRSTTMATGLATVRNTVATVCRTIDSTNSLEQAQRPLTSQRGRGGSLDRARRTRVPRYWRQ